MVAVDRIDPLHQHTKNAKQQGIDASGGKPEISTLGNSKENMTQPMKKKNKTT